MKIQKEGFWDSFKQGFNNTLFGDIITNRNAYRQYRTGRDRNRATLQSAERKIDRLRYTDEQKQQLLDIISTTPELEPILTRQKISNLDNASLLVSAYNQNVINRNDLSNLVNASRLSYDQLSYILYGVKNGMSVDDFRKGNTFMTVKQMQDLIISHNEHPEQYNDLTLPRNASDTARQQITTLQSNGYNATPVADYLSYSKESEVPTDILANICWMQVAGQNNNVIKNTITTNQIGTKDTVINYLSNEYDGDTRKVQQFVNTISDENLLRRGMSLSRVRSALDRYMRNTQTQPNQEGAPNETNNQ